MKEDGISNFNAVCFLRVYRQEQHNALVLLRERPGDYLGTRYAPFAIHFFHDLAPDRYHDNSTLRVLTDVWDPLLLRLGVTVHDSGWTNNLIPGAPPPTIPMSLTLVAATLFVLGLGAAALARVVRGRSRPGDVARAYLACTVAFVALVSIATEYGENGRFRFLVDPIVIGLAVAQVVTFVQARRRRPVARRVTGSPAVARNRDRRSRSACETISTGPDPGGPGQLDFGFGFFFAAVGLPTSALVVHELRDRVLGLRRALAHLILVLAAGLLVDDPGDLVDDVVDGVGVLGEQVLGLVEEVAHRGFPSARVPQSRGAAPQCPGAATVARSGRREWDSNPRSCAQRFSRPLPFVRSGDP